MSEPTIASSTLKIAEIETLIFHPWRRGVAHACKPAFRCAGHSPERPGHVRGASFVEHRFRAKRKQLKRSLGLLYEGRGPDLALAVLYVPCSSLLFGSRDICQNDPDMSEVRPLSSTANRAKRKQLKRSKDFSLKVKARIWP